MDFGRSESAFSSQLQRRNIQIKVGWMSQLTSFWNVLFIKAQQRWNSGYLGEERCSEWVSLEQKKGNAGFQLPVGEALLESP